MEPNSGPGETITYLLKHWDPLTLFLRKAGPPSTTTPLAGFEEGHFTS